MLNRNAVNDVLYKAWNNYKGLHIIDKGLSYFLFNLKEGSSCQGGNAKSSLVYAESFIMPTVLAPEVSVVELDFGFNPFWVQIHNPQLENLTTTLLSKVGLCVGDSRALGQWEADQRLY